MNHRILLFALAFCFMHMSHAQTFTKINYASADSDIINPERGFDQSTTTITTDPFPFDSAILHGYRNNGFSVIFRYVYLYSYKTGDISQMFLDSLSNDFAALRAAGCKVVLRFAYTLNDTLAPYGDCPINIVLRHIRQLKPILQQNSDVILTLQQGFVGAWGEGGGYTDYYGLPDSLHWKWRSQIAFAELNALPKNRMIQVRYVPFIYLLANDTAPIQTSKAYTGSLKARIGNHNDCFLSMSDDWGTYSAEVFSNDINFNDTVVYNRKYLSRDSKYMIQGGETCIDNPTYTNCPNSLNDLALMHWTFLNRDQLPAVYQRWEAQGCMNEVETNLGYRYRFLYSQIQDTSKAGGIFNTTIKLINDGYSNPVNPRIVQLVLRNQNTNQEYYLNYNQDIRLTTLNDTITLSFISGLPQGIPAGIYSLFLDMPDPEIRLYDNPLFSIRMANNNIWESTTGYNKLNGSLVVSNSSNVPVYKGTQVFAPKTKAVSANLYPNPLICNTYSNNVMLYWGVNNRNYYQVLQRSQENGPFTTIATLFPGIISYNDNNLSDNTSYKYRLYLTNNDTISQADTIETVTGNGSRYFVQIHNNDSMNDWSAISPVAAVYNNNDTTLDIRCFNNTDSVYFLTENIPNPRIYLQTDTTGLQIISFPGYLFNYLISSDSLYSMQINQWVFVKKVSVVNNGFLNKYSISFKDLPVFATKTDCILGLVSGTRVLPDTGTALARQVAYPTAPANIVVTYNPNDPGASLNLSWNKVFDATSYIVERSDGNSSDFKENNEFSSMYNHYTDVNLLENIKYYYRFNSVNGFFRSVNSDTVSGMTSALSIKIASIPGLKVYPNPISRSQDLHIELPGSSDTYKISLVNIYGIVIFSTIVNNNNITIPLSTLNVSTGTYILKIEGVTNLTRSVTRLIIN